MPKLSVWLLRAALIHMGIGFFFGAMILQHKGIPIYDLAWKLLNPHIELMVFGWTMQFVMGVAFFALPRFSGRESRYGATYLGWWSFVLLNIGVTVTAAARWFGIGGYALCGRVLVTLGVLLYVMMMWSRVKPLATPS
jgi:heme/copper-type cytochrome/quinol oxidase subunit 1